jgi:hypothetical protein
LRSLLFSAPFFETVAAFFFDRSLALDSVVRRLAIQTIKAQLALCELVSRSLVHEFSIENLPVAEKAAIVDRWNLTSRQRTELRLLLEEQEIEQAS